MPPLPECHEPHNYQPSDVQAEQEAEAEMQDEADELEQELFEMDVLKLLDFLVENPHPRFTVLGPEYDLFTRMEDLSRQIDILKAEDEENAGNAENQENQENQEIQENEGNEMIENQ